MAAHQASPSVDSPDKNTGVGCHFLLQCMKVKSESEVTQSRPTLSDPMDCSLRGPSGHGLCQARVLEWVAIAFSRPLALLRYNWHIPLYKFKVYNLMIWYMHILQMIATIRLVSTSTISHDYLLCVLWEYLRSISNFQVCNIVLLLWLPC